MICPDGEMVAIQVGVIMLHCFNRSQQFFPCYTVLRLSLVHGSAVVGNNLFVTIMYLCKHGTNCVATGICVEDKLPPLFV